MSWLGVNADPFILPSFLAILFTVLWIVGLVNAINWIDGLDGLASGIAFISSLLLFYFSLEQSLIAPAIISSSLAASSFAFLLYNFYPAKIYMGDGGSNFIGYSLAVISILVFSNSSSVYSLNTLAPLNINPIIPILIIFIPIIDMLYVISSRVIKGKSPFLPDRSHIHHRLLDIGLNHKQSVLLIYLLSILAGFIALLIYKS